MQTFLPYPDFAESAYCLDRQRLGKQRVEVLQLLRAINGETKGWRNHPAARMWQPYLEALVEYGVYICEEWISRGYRDNCRQQIIDQSWGHRVVMPSWLTHKFCRSHQSNLVRKNPQHYRPFFPDVPDNLPYVWPV